MATRKNSGPRSIRQTKKRFRKAGFAKRDKEISALMDRNKKKAQKNPPKLKTGVWIKADKVRVVQRNGRKVVEVKRFVKPPKRKRATAKRRR